MEAEGPFVVDLNRATEEELGALRSVGPVLAQRIVAYREEQGPFRSPADIAAIPDIGATLHKCLADRLTVTLTGALPMLAVEVSPDEAAEAGLPLAGKPPLQGEPAPEAEVPPPEEEPSPAAVGSAVSRMAPEEAPASSPQVGPAAPVAQEKPAPSLVASRGRVLAWLLSVLVGGVVGMIFTLLVLSGINGSLDIGHSRAVLTVQNRIENLALEMESLQEEVDELQRQLGLLEGLVARMDQAELAVSGMREETATLGERAEALEDRIEAVSEDLTEVQAQSQQVEIFFQRLQALLNEFFGGTEVMLTPTSPSATPSTDW